MTPDEVVAIVHPGDAVIWPVPRDMEMRDAKRFKEWLEEIFIPVGVRVAVSMGPALVVIRGYESAATPIYDEMAAGE